MEKKHQKTYEGLKIFVKPQRSVVASTPFAKGKLTLVPTTLKIEVKHDGDGPKESGSYVCIGRAGYADLSFYLMPCFNLPTEKKEGEKKVGFVSPYWCVRPTRDPNEANCEKIGQFSPTDGNSSLTIPTIQNSKDISVGDALLLYVPKIDKTPVLEDFQPLETGGKRRKKSWRLNNVWRARSPAGEPCTALPFTSSIEYKSHKRGQFAQGSRVVHLKRTHNTMFHLTANVVHIYIYMADFDLQMDLLFCWEDGYILVCHKIKLLPWLRLSWGGCRPAKWNSVLQQNFSHSQVCSQPLPNKCSEPQQSIREKRLRWWFEPIWDVGSLKISCVSQRCDW